MHQVIDLYLTVYFDFKPLTLNCLFFMDKELFKTLGFSWDREKVPKFIPEHSIEIVCFHQRRQMAQFIWDAGSLEGNPISYVETLTLLDGVSVGGHKLSDIDQLRNLAESTNLLLDLVKTGKYKMDRETCKLLNYTIAKDEALDAGYFRGEGKPEYHQTQIKVTLSDLSEYNPIPTEKDGHKLIQVFEEGIKALENLPPFERALAFFQFGTLQQFFFDGNKRTSRWMMNGVLMSNRINAISVPALRKKEFMDNLMVLYQEKDGTSMFQFLVDCHVEKEQILQMNKKDSRAKLSIAEPPKKGYSR